MKRILLATLTVGILATPSTAAAQPIQFNTDFTEIFSLKVSKPNTPQVLIPLKETPKPTTPVAEVKPPQPVVYTVVDGDNLSKIGTAYNVEWQRLWAKNTQLTNPDIIHVGDLITIPEPSEQLSREIPVQVQLPAETPGVAPQMSYDAGNTYDYGYCTWYVKNRRGASLPNGLGNANRWYWNAQRTGLPVGTEPRVGAVGTTTAGALGHVVYVESIDGGGKITISEMNALAGWGKMNTRTVNASEFVYIY